MRATCGSPICLRLELLAGQTRVQALVASQQRFRKEAHSDASLIHTRQSAFSKVCDSVSMTQPCYAVAILLRRQYLWTASELPLGGFLIEYQQQSELNSNVLPFIHTLLSVRYASAAYSTTQLSGVTHASTSAHAFATIYKPLPKEQ